MPHVLADKKVIDWRFEQLRKAGYSVEFATRLAGYGDIDLHVACELLRSGCEPVLAMLILL